MLSDEEVESADAQSWVTRHDRGMQVLFWDYTPPQTKESDQVYFKRDSPARSIGNVRVVLAGLPPGAYTLKVYKVGYGVNDVYTDYLKLNSPPTLTREQVRTLAEHNNGRPILSQRINVRGGMTRDFALRENDVYLFTLTRAGGVTNNKH
jgi:xylan 1,4-beta-xylosidase